MKKRLLKAISAIAAIGAMMAAFIVLGRIFPNFYICPVRRFLHLKCPGCGMTGAFLDFLRLDFASAMGQNALSLPIIAYLLYVFVPYTVRYVKDGTKKLCPKPEWLNMTFLAAIVVWTVVRNVLHI
ncbi:MAG: DUF2752 domain-containing protein [Clostridia bacterium]|nr:DUF2752 domain-containing protein [Clostridia bacterium]